MITQERLKEVLHYEPATGQFTWRLALSSRIFVGCVAGCRRDTGHIVIRIDGELYRAHQLAFLYMTGDWPKGVVDHMHSVKHDNRFSELRDATFAMNSQNVRDKPDMGVEQRPSGNWRAVLRLGTKKINFGTYPTKELARQAYLAAKRQHHPGYVEAKKYPESSPATTL